jgi:serine/threonine protein kinase
MADMHNQNHGIEFSMIMEDPDQELDWEKDTRHVNLAPWGCYHYPLAYQDPLPQALYHAEKNTFGMRGWIQIMRDIVRSLWFAASRGVHHRDMNGGNILYSTQPDVTIAGYLVDFGNARILDRPCLPAKYTKAKGCPEMHLLADDSRCANPTFQSLAAMKSNGAVDNYIWSLEELEDCRESIRQAELAENPNDRSLQWKREMLERAERDVPLALNKADKLVHRYIDDLESLNVMEYSASARLSLILLFASRSYAFL